MRRKIGEHNPLAFFFSSSSFYKDKYFIKLNIEGWKYVSKLGMITGSGDSEGHGH